MTAAVRNLLKSFNTLSDVEKHDATVEILKHSPPEGHGDIPDIALCELADDLFQATDRSESENAQP